MNDSTKVESVKSVIASFEAHRSKGVSADYLTKFLDISEPLVEGVIDHNTQKGRHSANNVLSRQFFDQGSNA